MNTGDTRFIYKNDLDKACFQHDSAYSDSKDLIKRNQSDKILRDKAFNIIKSPKHDQRGLASMVYKFFDKNLEEVVLIKKIRGIFLQNSQLANELHKPIIRKFKKRKVYSSFNGNI